MKKSYNELVNYLRYNIYQKKYDLEFLKTKLSTQVWFDILDRYTEGAAYHGLLPLLKIARECNCKWDDDTGICMAAAGAGHLDCLKYAHENGAPIIAATCEAAAENGHLECLKYAYEMTNSDENDDYSDCQCDEEICAVAAANGHLDCLKYAYENGCPWNKMVLKLAKKNGHVDCYEYAIDNECPGFDSRDKDDVKDDVKDDDKDDDDESWITEEDCDKSWFTDDSEDDDEEQ